MKPSVGRIVHFVAQGGSVEHYAAIVTRVWGDTCVNLRVFYPDQREIPHHGELESSVLADFGDDPQSRTWHWPEKVDAPVDPPKAVA